MNTTIRLALLAILIALGAAASRSASPALATATFHVNTTGDFPDAVPGNGLCATGSGLCSLRAAIQESNALAGPDTILFSLSGTFPKLLPTSELTPITSVVTIDGNSGGATKVELDGSLAPATSNGLITGSGGSMTVRNMVINRFTDAGINTFFSATSTSVQGSFLGTDTSGTIDLGTASMESVFRVERRPLEETRLGSAMSLPATTSRASGWARARTARGPGQFHWHEWRRNGCARKFRSGNFV